MGSKWTLDLAIACAPFPVSGLLATAEASRVEHRRK